MEEILGSPPQKQRPDMMQMHYDPEMGRGNLPLDQGRITSGARMNMIEGGIPLG